MKSIRKITIIIAFIYFWGLSFTAVAAYTQGNYTARQLTLVSLPRMGDRLEPSNPSFMGKPNDTNLLQDKKIPQHDDYHAKADQGEATVYSYFHAAGSAFRPRESGISWAVDDETGCVYLVSGDPMVWFNIHLDVPNGAHIEYLYIFYKDESLFDSEAFITHYDGEGRSENIARVVSTSNEGYGHQGSQINHTVDTDNYAYVLNWSPKDAGETMQLCGLRVDYHLP